MDTEEKPEEIREENPEEQPKENDIKPEEEIKPEPEEIKPKEVIKEEPPQDNSSLYEELDKILLRPSPFAPDF